MSSTVVTTVLGVDPGTQTGWAIVRDGKVLGSNTVSFSAYADKGYGAMFVVFRAFLTWAQDRYGPLTAIAYELPFSRGAFTTRITTGMAAHVQERCAAWQCIPIPVNTMTLKKFATGSGKAKKPEMMLASYQYLTPKRDAQTVSEHEADAIHIARWGYRFLNNF
jgi:Holliday junction resolvasome RuvABC endonuclease subunit